MDQFSLKDIVTPAGIIALGFLVRQFVEVLKGLFKWIDAGNERKVAITVALVAYIVWYLSYGTTPAVDGWLALTSWIAVSLAALGANSAIDAGQSMLARTLAKATTPLPEPDPPAVTDTPEFPPEVPWVPPTPEVPTP